MVEANLRARRRFDDALWIQPSCGAARAVAVDVDGYYLIDAGFGTDPMPQADIEMANFFTSEHPDHFFTQQPVMRFTLTTERSP